MTVSQILRELKPFKAQSRATLYKHLRALKIKPLGARQSPQRYPDDAPARILKHLGFAQTGGRKAGAR